MALPEAHAEPAVQVGVCYALFAYDAGLAINLDESERRITALTQRAAIRHKRRAPRYFEYRPAPLRVTQEREVLAVGAFRTAPSVDAVLRADSRRWVESLLAAIAPAVTRPGLTDFVETYVIFEIGAFTPPCAPAALYATYGQEVARILRSERAALSDQEVDDAVGHRISFGSEEVTVIDWDAALIADRDAEDVRAVLEFANVELLEMRYLDQQLDDALDESYDTLSRRYGLWLPGATRADLRRIGQLQVDNAVLFEGVNNALKLLGDQYLARVYRLVSERFHLAEWDASILRKLQSLESIYQKLSDQAANRRTEALEWIIIVLIAAEILIPFVPRLVGLR